jgi:phosphatidylserine/phosphatidylglycerophosphate/cardiolipin synthase-like enzyme
VKADVRARPSRLGAARRAPEEAPRRVRVGRRRTGFLVALIAGCASLSAGCATTRAPVSPEQVAAALARAGSTSAFGPASDFAGSPDATVGHEALAPVRGPDECEVAILPFGEDSLAARLASLERATESIRIQALIFKGDEAGLRLAEVLKRKKAEGLDVRVIVDAFSNPWLQTQWLFFDLKQHGIEVEGYEALALQWLNEVPLPLVTASMDTKHPDRRSHEKIWIVDGGTPHAFAITGGLNVGNEYFRVDPENPAGYWRDQDVAVRGAVVADLVAAFDRNFEHFVRVKHSRGIFDTNLYWNATRHVMDSTGRLPISFRTDPRLVERVATLASREPELAFRPSTCRFFHSRPRVGETYLTQVYLQLIAAARTELLIANAYFVPTPTIKAALEDAVRRCVAVTIVANSPETNDLPEISMVGRGHYAELLRMNEQVRSADCADPRARLSVWEWVGESPDDSVRSGTMHSKFAVIDRHLSLVGSYNLDPRSERLNSETALVFENPQLGAELARAVLEHDLRYSREITPERAAEFANPGDVIYRFRKQLGSAFEGEL